MLHLRVKLNGVKTAFGAAHSGDGAVIGVGNSFEALGHLDNVVGMAHPADVAIGHFIKNGGGAVVIDSDVTVFTVVRGNLAAENMGHKLCAVAYTENGYIQLKQSFFI